MSSHSAITVAEAQGKVTVVDSTRATIAEGFVAIRAAEAAASGATRSEVVAAVREAIPHVGFLAAFDTTEYLRRGGRIGAASLHDTLTGKFPGAEIYESRATPVIGTQAGPGLLVVSVLGDPG